MARSLRSLPLAFSIACGAPTDAAPAPVRASLGDAIARVEGQEIARAEVERLVTASGLSPERALQRLIEERLLVAHARERGYDALPAMQRELDRALVRALLAEELGVGTDPAQVEAQRTRLDALLEALGGRTQVRYDEAAISRAFSPKNDTDATP
jgi:hypothetical protein